jgi:hypothetical protein
VSNGKKKEAWENVVNAMSFIVRTLEELKKKWDDMKRGTKECICRKNDQKTGYTTPYKYRGCCINTRGRKSFWIAEWVRHHGKQGTNEVEPIFRYLHFLMVFFFFRLMQST